MSESTQVNPSALSGAISELEVFAQYGLAGSLGTGAHYAVMWVLLTVVSPLAATTSGAAVGCLINYLLVRAYVFPSGRSVRGAFLRFLAVASGGVLLNGIVVCLAHSALPILPSQLLATAVVLVLGFLINKSWTFHA
ncbi:MAG: GtrA family protein [Pseudomonadota bacterium]